MIASDLLLSGAALFLGFYFKSRPFHATGLALLAFGSLQLGLDKENPKRITDQPAETENRSVPEIEIPKYRKKITVRDPHWEWPERPDPIPDRAQLFVCRTEASEGTTVLVLSNEKRIPMNQFQALPLTPSLWEQEFPDRPFEEGNERLESDEYLIYWGPSFDQEKREMCEYRFWSVQEIEINTELPDFALNYESIVGTMEQGSDTSFLSLNDDVVTIEVSDDYPPNDLRSALLDVRYDYSDEVPSVSLKVSGPDLINAVNLLHSESGVPHDGGLPFNNLAPTVDIRCADGHCLIFGLSEKPSPLLQSYLQELVRIAFLVEPILPDS
ncbi:MAG: hypothetical protein HYW02_06300 [Deltaproteobacteria bacterium]|nr:hypothetical protein [Deltaproteobacteria bacterium]